MFEHIQPFAGDPIFALVDAFNADPRAHKVNLSIGIYFDEQGRLPVLDSVRQAEARLLEAGGAKPYLPMEGDAACRAEVQKLLFGPKHAALAAGRVATIQTVGSSGGLRVGADFLKAWFPDSAVWVSDPTWDNHRSMFDASGFAVHSYPYYDDATGGVAFDAMKDAIGRLPARSIVLLHACCHNPTGVDLSRAQWDALIPLLAQRGVIPYLDLAYQGFGDGLDADAAPTRMVAARLPEVMIAASCSKNFGIYRERTGCLLVLSDAASKDVTQGTLAYLNRQNYSFSPDHGARLVTMILEDDSLRADWQAELEEVRLNMLGLRQALADELRKATNSDRFDFVAHHRGMFSRLGLTQGQVDTLRVASGIYMVGDSRINIAGLNARTVRILAAAIAKVTA